MRSHLLKHNTTQSKAIGVMDSGVGGLSVLKHIHALLPHEDLIYFADSQHAPYGNKTSSYIQDRVATIAEFLLSHDAKSLVIACNTATAAAAKSLREHYDIPIIAMEPAVKPASIATKNGIIGVLATVGTLQSAQFAALLATYGKDLQVITQGCIGLVECIERGEINTDNTKTLLSQYCEPLLNAGADTIVLGCTHYPFVRDMIQQIVGDHVTIVDTGAAVAKHLQSTLQSRQLITSSQDEPSITVWTNNTAANTEQVIQQLWGKDNVIIESIASS